MELDLTLVASFIVLVREQHYGHAAQELHLTPSALSRQIHRLERQLDAVLVDRGPAGVLELTPAGRQFATDAPGVLAVAQGACERARSVPPVGTIRIGVSTDSRRLLDLAGLLGVVRAPAAFPAVQLIGVVLPAGELVPSLARCEVDVVVTATPATMPGTDTVRAPSGRWFVHCRHVDRREPVRAVVRGLTGCGPAQPRLAG